MILKNKEVVILATVTAKPGKETELERALRDVAGTTRAQRGCLQFELYRSAQNPATITAFERWSSEEDHARHIQDERVKSSWPDSIGILAARRRSCR